MCIITNILLNYDQTENSQIIVEKRERILWDFKWIANKFGIYSASCLGNASASIGRNFPKGITFVRHRERNVDSLESETFPSVPIARSTRS